MFQRYNQECKVRPEVINMNSNEPSLYSYSVKINKCSGSCNNINNPYAKLCVPHVVRDINLKVFRLISITNETRHRKWHETCKCKCRLDPNVFNKNQRWNKDKCRYEYKELIDKGICDKGFIWNPSNCDCECNKSCNVGQYLDYENCNYRKRLIDKLVEECSETIERNEITNVALYKYKDVCGSCTLYIVLLVIFLVISINISIVFICFNWYIKTSSTNITNINPSTETTVY